MNMASDTETGMRAWIEQIDGAAALLRPSPWRLTPNAALDLMLGRDSQDLDTFCHAFDQRGGELLEQLTRRRPFQGRLRTGAPHAPGSMRVLHASFAPLEGTDDWLCTFVDLTPVEGRRRRRDLTLERLRHTLDQLQELISLIDQDETVLYINASYARFFGTTQKDAPGHPLLRVMGEENYARTQPSRQELFRTLQPVRYERALHASHGEDRVMGVLLWPIRHEQSGRTKMATLTRDVTLRQRGMEALGQTLERLDALFEAGIEGILLCEDGRISDANPVACRHIGLAREQLVGQPLARALQLLGLHDTDSLCGAGDPADLLLCLRPGGGARPALQIQSIPFMDDRRPCHAVLLQDMSYRQQAQRRIDRLVGDLRQQTARAEAADRGKSVFLASASHDLRQPIHSLGLFLTTIQSLGRSAQPLASTTLRPIAQRMRSSLDGLMQLLDMLLGASMLDAGREQVARLPTPLQAHFDELVTEFAALASSKGLVLRAVPSRAWVMTDPTVLRRILSNLVANAVRYTERGRIVIGARARGNQVEVQVWDTGVGIANEQLDSIFEAFYRVDLLAPRGDRSEGLGLSIAKRSAAQLDARLDVRSVRGHGSMFSVLLPRCAQGQAGVPRAAPAIATATAKGVGKQVLLIDDDEQVVEATINLLESWGHHVLSASSAREAMGLCEAGTTRFDAVICDYMIDPSTDGLQMLLQMRTRQGGHLPVCMITGDVSAQRIEQARRHGIELLHKPVSASALQRFLQGAG